jgi:hypothetical protein
MKQRKKIFILLMLAVSINIYAQKTESFDLASYTIPKGWKKETGNGSVSYSITAQQQYAKLIVYKSIAGTGVLNTDFNKEWNDLVVTPYKTSTAPDLTEENLPNDWKIKTGTSTFSFNGSQSVVILMTAVSKGNKMSLVFLTNSDKYMADLETIGNSLQFKKATTVSTNTITNNNTNNQPAVNSSYSFTTTNFDDGWTSTVENDYVLVEKNNHSVYLNFSVPYNASQFSGTGIRDAAYYWDNYVTRQFTVKTNQFNDGSSMALKPPYMEGYATDKRTGKSCFIGMYLVIVPNAASVVIGTAPDENAFRRLFPKANDPFGSDLAAMNRYNKFAVATKDLAGMWQNGNTETAHWYYVSPSGYEGYAGMTLAATSATFQFNTNGTYSSIHNGVTGAVGNMNTFQQEYKGNYSVSNWSVSATNRYGGKTHKFDVQFVAVRGGRLLKMNNNAGENYTLVKVK